MPASDGLTLRLGACVRHTKFGDGVVIASDSDPDWGELATVIFRLDRGEGIAVRKVRAQELQGIFGSGDLVSLVIEATYGKGLANQGIGVRTPYMWNGHVLRSNAERRISEALDRAGVVFFPNPRGRYTAHRLSGWERSTNTMRSNFEPDFIVCCNGRWGMLEVDGMQHDLARDRQHDEDIKSHDIRLFRSPASMCEDDPDYVVRCFLKWLEDPTGAE